MRTVSVRVNGVLAQQVGSARVQLSLPEEATVGDLLDALCGQYPSSTDLIRKAIPVIKGNHVSAVTALPSADPQVSLLMPVSGG